MATGQLSQRLREVAKRGLGRAADAAGYELVARHFYSPLPDLERLRPSL